MDLDEVADELYEVPPEEFIALRKERQDEAKADGDKALAKEIGALPKPSAAAWACNLLVREQREEIEGLVELGTLLREAQESLAGDQLRALDVQRRQLISALTRQARALANERGPPDQHGGRHPGRGDPAGGHGRPGGGGGAAVRPAHVADVLQRHGDDGVAAGPAARAPAAPGAARRRRRSPPPDEAAGGVGRRPPAPRAGGAAAGRRGEAPAGARRGAGSRRGGVRRGRRGARRRWRSTAGRPRSSPPATPSCRRGWTSSPTSWPRPNGRPPTPPRR